ncbi:MAG: AEC family transporter [Desulfurococcaceae archaeon]
MNGIYLFAVSIMAGYISRVVLEKGFGLRSLYNKIISILIKAVYYILIPLAFTSIFLERGLTLLDLYVFIYYIVFIVILHATTTRTKNIRDNMALFLVSSFPNSVFLGFPVVLAVLGRIYIAAIFGVITVVLNIVVPDIISAGKISLKPVFSSTGFIGFLIGVLAHYITGSYAYVIYSYIHWSSSLLSYAATFTMGMRIPVSISVSAELKKAMIHTCIYRFIAAPLLAYAFSFIFGIRSLDRTELVVVSSMPPAVMNALVAEKYKWDSQLVALIIALMTIIYLLLVLPLYILMIRSSIL